MNRFSIRKPVEPSSNQMSMKSVLISLVLLLPGLLLAAQQSDSAAYYHQKGTVEMNARRFREAEKYFALAYGFDAKNLDNLVLWAGSLLEQRRYAEAREKFLLAEGLDGNHPTVIENLATLSFNLRKFEDAIRYSLKIRQLKKGTTANLIIAKSYYQLENYGEAVKFCEYAFKDQPGNAEVPYIAGRAFMDMNNYRRAAGCFDQALALDSSNATWMYEAGLAWYAVPDDKKALYWIEKAGEKGYKKTSDYMENLATAYLNTGQLEKGVGILLEILKRKPQDPTLLYSIAETYYKAKKYPEAIEYWDRVLELDKKNANALYMIGMSYQKKGETDKGRQLCDKAIEMDPSLAKLKEERKMPGGL